MPENSLSQKVHQLINQQIESWPLATSNYAGLASVASRTIEFDGFKVKVQFNPERIRSSAAKTDAKSIQQRACFLCQKNQPEVQKGVDFQGDYTLLVNPFPIFKKHLTVPLNRHLPQEIEPYFNDLLQLSRELPEFTFFYNGPKCGASAPDHFHFQAGNANEMSIDTELDSIVAQLGEPILQNEHTRLVAVGKAYLRKLLYLESDSSTQITYYFQQILERLKQRGQEGEPMLNVLARFTRQKWRIVIFPRDRQRPSQFFAEGQEQILMSPASVEMGGLAILPRKEDFEKLTAKDLISIYEQVTINDTDFERLKDQLKGLAPYSQ